jgi:hypothetical protein
MKVAPHWTGIAITPDGKTGYIVSVTNGMVNRQK